MRLSPDTPREHWPGRIDAARVDATDEAAIQAQMAADEEAARADAAAYARRLQRRLGLSQAESPSVPAECS
ncbi:hypothetical protein [Pelomicrobium methylotrophicum]|uniref:Uncharacterized protein n=1 Tax=Pelomicrobium methylotrophicum TaxID=2602750 RepID=A0A5C7EVB4_9PROT|nr:hypothetical protein [Pelomicrobium methylotrophicum]TXF11186.1 hypothetical protein FR698_11785 [Pelomicrobium methylotrophicum]